MKNIYKSINLLSIFALPLIAPYYMYKKVKSKINFADEESYVTCCRIEAWYNENFKNRQK